jgi:hypothetical protein
MRAADTTVGALLVCALAVICCAGPLLVGAISTTALAAWLSKSVYVTIPAAIIAAGIAVFWFQRRPISA